MAVLLIKVDDFKDRSFVDTNVDEKTLKLSINLAQDQIVEPVLGTNLMDQLKDYVMAKSMPIPYQNLLVKYVWPIIIQATEIIAQKKILYRITNDSIVKSSNANSAGVDISELRDLLRDNEVYLNQYVRKLQLYLTTNSSSFPEYYQSDPDDIPAESGTSAISFYYDQGDIYIQGPSSRP